MCSTAACAVGSSGQGHGEVLTTTSTIVAEAATGSHVLEIKGYSLTKGLGNGKFITSSSFSVGGYRWCIRYYPDGDRSDSADWISMFLDLDLAADEDVDVKAQPQFCVLNDFGKAVPEFSRKSLNMANFSANRRPWGFDKFVERKTLEESVYVKDDCLCIRCDITIQKDIRTEAAATHQFVVLPPSDMHQHFGHLLTSAEGTKDVTFEVAGEMFPAHRCVLAARSSVFMAELFGSMKEKAMDRIRIDDMEPRVFKAMLYFIYTDTMPQIVDKEDAFVITQHLLVAADMYDIERLKLMCEHKLCSYIDTSTVATTLALAEQHGCHGLKKACFKLLQSPSLLKIATATEGFDHLISSCPSLIKELMLAKVGACP